MECLLIEWLKIGGAPSRTMPDNWRTRSLGWSTMSPRTVSSRLPLLLLQTRTRRGVSLTTSSPALLRRRSRHEMT